MPLVIHQLIAAATLGLLLFAFMEIGGQLYGHRTRIIAALLRRPIEED